MEKQCHFHIILKDPRPWKELFIKYPSLKKHKTKQFILFIGLAVYLLPYKEMYDDLHKLANEHLNINLSEALVEVLDNYFEQSMNKEEEEE